MAEILQASDFNSKRFISVGQKPIEPDFNSGDFVKVKPEITSILDEKNDLVVNTSDTNAKRVSYMSDTQVANVPREKYFGMNKTDDNFLEDLISDDNNLLQDFGRGAANIVIGTGQDIKRFGQKIGARAIINARGSFAKLKGEDVSKFRKDYNDLIAGELVEIAKENEQYRKKLGIARTEYDGIVYDLGSVFAQLGMSVLLKSPTAMATIFGISQQQQLSEEIFETTGEAGRAEVVATLVAIPVAMLEFIGTDRFLKAIKGDRIISNIIRSSITEAVEEGLQGVIEESIVQTFGGREKDLKETATDIAYEMLLAIIGAGTVAGAVGFAEQRFKNNKLKNTKPISEKIVNEVVTNKELHQATAEILKNQHDNTTNYGNSTDAGITEVKKSIDAKLEQLQNLQDTRENLIEEGRNGNVGLTEQQLLDILEQHDDLRKQLNKLPAEKGLLQFIKESGGIFDEGAELKSRDLIRPFILRKKRISKGIDVSPDAVALRAFEEGFFDERPTLNEFYDKIDEELRGVKALKASDFETSVERNEIIKQLEDIEASNVNIDKIRELKKLAPTPEIRKLGREVGEEERLLFQRVKARTKAQRAAEGLPPIEIDQKAGLAEALGRTSKDFKEQIDLKVQENNIRQDEIANQTFLGKTINLTTGLFETVKDSFNSVTQPVSSIIENISPKLWNKIDKYIYRTGIEQKKALAKVKPFNDKLRKLDKESFYEIDLYLKNITIKEGELGFEYKKRLDVILKEKDMVNEFNQMRTELNKIYGELREVGIPLGFLENYIPRMVDLKQKEAYLAYLKGSKEYSDVIFALEKEKFYNDMSLEERAKFVNNFLRGFIPKNLITLSRIGNIKFQRSIQEIDANLNQFYLKTGDALIKYVESTKKLIQQKKLFGAEPRDMSALRTKIKRKRTQLDKNIEKGANKKKINQIEQELKLLEEQVELMSNGSLGDSVGQMVYELTSKEKITSREEKLIKRSLTAIINFKSTPKGIQFAKNLTYAITLGNIKNSITQIGDLGISLYESGFVSNVEALTGQKKIDVRDLGIDSIMSELSTQDGLSKFVNLELKLTGLNKMDLLLKNVNVNSRLIETRKLLKKNDVKINQELDFIFDEFDGQSEQVKKDIINGVNSEDVGFYLYHKLSESQPINIAAMPLAYLENPNARLLWALKTFALKQLDFTRKEIFGKMRTEPLQALKNLIRLQTTMMLMGATKDLIKSLWDDEELIMGDIFLNNILIYNLIGRYTFKTASQRGVGSAVINFVTPPLAGIADKIQKGKFLDVIPFGKDLRAIENAGQL